MAQRWVSVPRARRKLSRRVVRTTIARSPTDRSRSIIPLDAGHCGSFPLLESSAPQLVCSACGEPIGLEGTKAISGPGDLDGACSRGLLRDGAEGPRSCLCVTLGQTGPRPQPERDRRDRGAAERAVAAAIHCAASITAGQTPPHPAISGLIVTSRR